MNQYIISPGFFSAYLFLAVLGLAGLSLVAVSRGYSLVVVHELLVTVVSLVVEQRLYVTWALGVVLPVSRTLAQ